MNGEWHYSFRADMWAAAHIQLTVHWAKRALNGCRNVGVTKARHWGVIISGVFMDCAFN